MVRIKNFGRALDIDIGRIMGREDNRYSDETS